MLRWPLGPPRGLEPSVASCDLDATRNTAALGFGPWGGSYVCLAGLAASLHAETHRI